MRSLSLYASTVVLLLACTFAGQAGDNPLDARKDVVNTAQVSFSVIIVNGRTLTGPNSSAETRDGRLLIPIATLARALGDAVQIDPTGRILIVVRQTGKTAAYDSRLGQISENGALILSVSNPGLSTFAPNVEQAMLPIEIVSTLFEAAIRIDQQKNAVLVSRGITGMVTQQKNRRGLAEIYQADFEYNLNQYSSTNSQNLTINSIGRFADGRFSLVANSSGDSFRKLSPRYVNFSLERPNGQHFVAGDLGAGNGLQLMTSNIRGALASIPVGDLTIAAFGGRSFSGTVSRTGGPEPGSSQNRFAHDTNVFGLMATTRPYDSGTLKPLIVSAGVMYFGGAARHGNIVSTGINFGGRRLQIQADLGVGTFKGRSIADRVADGAAAAVDIAASFQAATNLSFQGRFAHIGSNFLAPQSGVREPIELRAGGVSWSPVKWLTTSVNASTTRRPNDTGRAESFVSTAVAVSPGGTKPQLYISHTQSSSRTYRTGEFTLINISKNFQRTRLYINATRVRNIGPASSNVQVGANFLLNEKNTLEVNQGFANRGAYNGFAEWRTDRFLTNRISLSAGIGYNYSQSAKLNTYEKFTAALRLPRESSLQVSYQQTSAGPTLLIRLRGTLFRKRQAASYLNSQPLEANNFSSVSGRVYQDIDSNGKYNPGTDKPQTSVKVRVDGNRYVETDANGFFTFEAIASGTHKIYVDLLSVRADLTLLDAGSHEIVLGAGKNTLLDFRLIRTGRIAGRVFHDKNANGTFDEGESPLTDIRVVTASGRDTLTDGDGYFSIADLAPGDHVVLVDEKTLPEKIVSFAKPLAVHVFAGRETNEVFIACIDQPAEVKRFGSPKQP